MFPWSYVNKAPFWANKRIDVFLSIPFVTQSTVLTIVANKNIDIYINYLFCIVILTYLLDT